MITKDRLKAITSRWYATERSPQSLDDKWFLDLELLSEELLKERDAYREAAINNWQPTVTVYPLGICPYDREGKVDAEVERLLKEKK